MKIKGFCKALSNKSFLIVMFFLFSVGTRAQEFRGTISGSVSDQSGAEVASASVTALEVSTGTRTATASDASGQYTIPFLGPGIYQIEVQMSGFGSFVRKGIQLSSSDHPVVDVTLQIGSVSQAVEVTADVPLINK